MEVLLLLLLLGLASAARPLGVMPSSMYPGINGQVVHRLTNQRWPIVSVTRRDSVETILTTAMYEAHLANDAHLRKVAYEAIRVARDQSTDINIACFGRGLVTYFHSKETVCIERIIVSPFHGRDDLTILEIYLSFKALVNARYSGGKLCTGPSELTSRRAVQWERLLTEEADE